MRSVLVRLTHNANIIRLKPTPAPRFPLVWPSAAIGSVVHSLLSDAVYSLCPKESSLTSCSSQSPLLVPLSYSILYFISLGLVWFWWSLSLYLFTHNFTRTLRYFFLSGYKFFNIFPIMKYGLGSFRFNLTGFGDCFYQRNTYNRSEVLWFLRWGRKRPHIFCLVLLECPCLCMFTLEILGLQTLLFGIQLPTLWKALSHMERPDVSTLVDLAFQSSLPRCQTHEWRNPGDSRLQWSKLPPTIHQSQARVPDITE